ncbi:MAG: rebM 1 [Labilithrix sp.]|nr:rebM 1 [Labilithrix sp.]
MLPRILEAEVMDTEAEARDYDAMDHAAVNARFCDDFLAFWGAGAGGRIVDFGTGTGLIPIALAGRAPGFDIVGIDLAEHMLAYARQNVERAGLGARISFAKVDAKGTSFPDGAFAATMSNSIVHHIPAPERSLAEMWRVVAPGGVLFVRDLHRPQDEAEVERLLALHGGEPPADPSLVASFEHQRKLFRDSLCASLTVSEVVDCVAPLGIPRSAVAMTSDRHWTLAARKP